MTADKSIRVTKEAKDALAGVGDTGTTFDEDLRHLLRCRTFLIQRNLLPPDISPGDLADDTDLAPALEPVSEPDDA